MIVYDFDDTIYDGDSSVDFYKYCLGKKPFIVLWSFIVTLFWVPLYILKIKNHREVKEKVFHFLVRFNNVEELVEDFWDNNQHKIKKWYLEQQQKDDVVISASFDFLIKPICYRLKIKNVIASDYNLKTGKIIGPNCHGRYKIQKFEAEFPNKKIIKAYSDSSFDIPLLEYAKEGYVVLGNKIVPYEGHIFERKFMNFLFDLHLLGSLLTSFIGGLLLVLITAILNCFLDILIAFTISYFISIILAYILGIKYVYKNKTNLRKIIELFLLSVPHFILLLCFVYILQMGSNISLSLILLICLVFYVPAIDLIFNLLDEKKEKKDDN